MQEKRRAAGTGERGCDLAGDVAGFAHAGHDDAALAVQQAAAGCHEAIIDAAPQRADGLCLGIQHRQRHAFEALVIHASHHSSSGMASLRQSPSGGTPTRVGAVHHFETVL